MLRLSRARELAAPRINLAAPPRPPPKTHRREARPPAPLSLFSLLSLKLRVRVCLDALNTAFVRRQVHECVLPAGSQSSSDMHMRMRPVSAKGMWPACGAHVARSAGKGECTGPEVLRLPGRALETGGFAGGLRTQDCAFARPAGGKRTLKREIPPKQTTRARGQVEP